MQNIRPSKFIELCLVLIKGNSHIGGFLKLNHQQLEVIGAYNIIIMFNQNIT